MNLAPFSPVLFPGVVMNKLIIGILLLLVALVFASGQKTDGDAKKESGAKVKKACFTAQTRELAARTAKVLREHDPNYDPVLGSSRATGPRRGAPPVNENGLGKPFSCVANKKPEKGCRTLPKV